jgi:hypothetical protein
MNISVDTNFNIINLAARAGLVIFLIRKYLVHRIRQSLVYEQQEISLLQQQQAHLREACGDLERNMKQQEQEYDRLQAKFVIWQQHVAKALEQERDYCVGQESKMQAHMEKKQQYIKHRFIIEHEFSGLLHESEKKLQLKFNQDKALGKAYITKVLRALYE